VNKEDVKIWPIHLKIAIFARKYFATNICPEDTFVKIMARFKYN